MARKTIKEIGVTFKREIPAMTGRRLRALLHQAYIGGNDSYEPHETDKGLNERNEFIGNLLIKEGLAKPRT